MLIISPTLRSYVSNGEERVLWLAKIFPSIQKKLWKGRAAVLSVFNKMFSNFLQMFSMSFTTVLCVKKGHYCNIIASMPLVRRVVPARISPYIIRFFPWCVLISNPLALHPACCLQQHPARLLVISIRLLRYLAVTLVSND